MRGRTNADGQGVALNANTRKCVVAQNQSVTEGDFVDFVSEYSGELLFEDEAQHSNSGNIFALSDGRYLVIGNGIRVVTRVGNALIDNFSPLDLSHKNWTQISPDHFAWFESNIYDSASSSSGKAIFEISAGVMKFNVLTNSFEFSDTITREYSISTPDGIYGGADSSIGIDENIIYGAGAYACYNSSSSNRYKRYFFIKTSWSGENFETFNISTEFVCSSIYQERITTSVSFGGFAKIPYGVVFAFYNNSNYNRKLVSWDESQGGELFFFNVNYGATIVCSENGYLYMSSLLADFSSIRGYRLYKFYFTSISKLVEYGFRDIFNTNESTGSALAIKKITEDEKYIRFLALSIASYLFIIDIDKTTHELIDRPYIRYYDCEPYVLGVLKTNTNEILVNLRVRKPTTPDRNLHYTLQLMTFNELGDLYEGVYDIPVVAPITSEAYVKGVAKNSGVGGEEITIYTPFV